MKTRIRLKFITGLIIFLGFGTTVRASTYYVVVGNFSQEHGASMFVASLKDLFPDASITFDAKRSLYYVYAIRTQSFRDAEDFRSMLASRIGFANSWIFADFEDRNVLYETASAATGIRLELYSGDMVFLSPADSNIFSVSKHGPKTKVPEGRPETRFGFVAKNRSGLVMSGKVAVMRGREVASIFKTGDIASFGGRQRTITFVCEVPGYNPAVREIDMTQLGGTPGVYLNGDGVWEIAFALTRTKTDEISLMYHALFYDNAAILHPSAKDRLEVLASMMHANPGLRISINAHCNPRHTRDIRQTGKEGHLFDIEGAQLVNGSDKQLTRLRAECIRDHLVASGVGSERISMMGWGHLNMIVSGAESDHAINDRVEVGFNTSYQTANVDR